MKEKRRWTRKSKKQGAQREERKKGEEWEEGN
jgi:hypothetical protein